MNQTENPFYQATPYETYLPLGQTSLKKSAYEIMDGPINPVAKKKQCSGGLVAVAIITTLAVVGLLIIAVIAIIWVVNSQKKSSGSTAVLLSLPTEEKPPRKIRTPIKPPVANIRPKTHEVSGFQDVQDVYQSIQKSPNTPKRTIIYVDDPKDNPFRYPGNEMSHGKVFSPMREDIDEKSPVKVKTFRPMSEEARLSAF